LYQSTGVGKKKTMTDNAAIMYYRSHMFNHLQAQGPGKENEHCAYDEFKTSSTVR